MKIVCARTTAYENVDFEHVGLLTHFADNEGASAEPVIVELLTCRLRRWCISSCQAEGVHKIPLEMDCSRACSKDHVPSEVSHDSA